jgi:hypothetical protein
LFFVSGMVFGLLLLSAPVQDEGALLRRLCLECHSSAKKKGDFDLEKLGTPSPAHDGEWEKVRINLAHLMMPPASKPQPSAPERDRLVAWIDRALDGPAGAKPSDPGFVTLRRLTRTELNRTLSDLLGIDGAPADALPPDAAGGAGSFENNADALFVSATHLERMFEVALEALGKAKPERLGVVAPEKDKTGVETPALRKKAAELSLASFVPRAWRRPVPTAELRSLLSVYDRGTARKLTHEDALRLTYAAALVSPNFLYLVEANRGGSAPWELSAHELAARVSYFLWSTMPDAELTAKANDGSLLRDPQVLTGQVARLLGDPRSAFFAEQFMGQWLGTADLDGGKGPDAKSFPEYSDALRGSMMREPGELFRWMLAENRSLLELIDADYVFADGELAKLYGVDGGGGFSRRAVSGGRRGGLLTMAGVLAATSRPSRTSPVVRGKWILEELLSTPPPPPPPNVPPLPGDGSPNAGSLRSRLERHRADPNCTGCHQRIDPLGFGLENYDPLGRWRDRGPAGEPLDTLGELPTGERFNGPAELKKLLVQRKERVMTTVVERLLSYALGRGLSRYDRPTVREIVSRLQADGWKSRTLVNEIVLSLPFRYRRGAAPPSPQTKEKTP